MAGQGTAVILGATSGIGREMALWFAGHGWRVGITGRRGALLDQLAAERPDAFVARTLDVTCPDSLGDGMAWLDRELGGIDIIVISAGTGDFNPGLDDTTEQTTLTTNVTGFTRAAGWAYRYFAGRGHGTLAAITSVAGLLGSGPAPAYSASKSFQITYLDGLRRRARKEAPGVAVVDIRPGSVRTDMMKGDGHFWIASPERAAEVACRAVVKRKAVRYVTPRWAVLGVLVKIVGLFS